MATRVIQARTSDKLAAAAAEGASALKAGRLVGFATETVYGIAALATRHETMERLRKLKSRPSQPFSVHLGRPGDAGRYVRNIPAGASRLIEKAWPGPLTLLLQTGGALADEKLQAAGMHDVLCSEGYIGLRCPDSDISRAMLSAVLEPIVAPSANPAGKGSARDAQEVLAYLDGQIDLLIDTGPTRYGKDSTILKFDDAGWHVVRKGVLDARMIRSMLVRRILFVCTGNTCRSPIAAGVARKLLAERAGTSVGQLRRTGLEVESAGLCGAADQRATPEAVGAARQLGVDLTRHRSQKLTIELINSADLIFCMTGQHVAEVRRLVPPAADKVRRLDRRADISDPVGAGAEVYDRIAERIQQAVAENMDRLEL